MDDDFLQEKIMKKAKNVRESFNKSLLKTLSVKPHTSYEKVNTLNKIMNYS